MKDELQYEGIAIVGMAGRFPGADNVGEFWRNLLEGRESVSFFTDAELADSGLDGAALRARGNYVPARGVLKDADCFDAAFFGVHPKEAEVMDPQQRIFLETCWAALESAGYAPNNIDAVVGVFGGVSFNTYYMHALHRRPDLVDLVGPELVMFGNEKDYVTTRVAYKLGLKGPALNVSTACSTSLVAVVEACQSLLTFQCDLAVAGAASVTVPQKRGYFHDEGNIGSADGHTRTFDIRASGTAFGNGVGIVVLKRLEDAVRDSDQVYAVIKGAALNNDGSQRVSFGAPGVDGQSKVIAMAHALAGIDPETISYVEAHGTATPLGDPIEVAALTKAFRAATNARQFCALGSLKSNVGHLDVAAGVAGLIKTALALRDKVLPASLHFTKPNPKLDLEHSPFYVNSTLQPWPTLPDAPRRAGISSFGTGGTNAHIVLEEAPAVPVSGPSRPWQLLPLSARTPEALDRMTAGLSDHLKQQKEDAPPALADSAFTLATGRSVFPHRRIVVCRNAEDGAAALDARDPKRVYTQHQQHSPQVIFMFPGQGAQYPGMASELYRNEPVFREEVDRCAAILGPLLHTNLLSVIFPSQGSEKEAEKLLVQTSLTQPALFVIEYALAKLWMSWGIRPAAMIGHSVGEYVAGCLAGVFKLADAAALVARRGALVQAQPGGAMLVVRQPESEVQPLLGPDLAIAAINSPNLCVVAGPYEPISALEKDLGSRSIATKRLHTSHAFHSPMMDPVLPPFTDLLRQVEFGEPQIPYVSNVTARWITPAEARSPEYWAGHVRQTVRFADGVGEFLRDPKNLLLEVGPGQTLATLARQHPAKTSEQIVLASLPLAGGEELRGFLETLGKLWMSGVPIDWPSFYGKERRQKTALPTYPFERKRFWPESATQDDIAPETSRIPLPADAVPSPPVAVPAGQTVAEEGSRRDRLVAAVRSLLGKLSGYDLAEVEPSTDLMELGFDSLLLTQASQVLHREFRISISFRQLMEDLSSIQAVASYLDEKMPPDTFASAHPAPVPGAGAISPPPASVLSQDAMVQQLFQQQQLLTSQLLQLLGRQPDPARTAPPSPGPPPTVKPPVAKHEGKSHGPFKPFDRHATSALSPAQTAALEALIARYTARTPKSKKLAAENRPILADPRSVSGFNRHWKEMVYPILTTHSDGSRVWDVDGNEYVDFVMGFGASLFGHRPPFVVQAVQEQLALGFEIGPIQPIAGEVAAMIREFVGMERVAFTNTGSEAVLAATRVARTVTGRDKIAVFAGSYHGIFDEVLFRPLTVNGETRTATIAPGVPESAVSEVIILDYGNPRSLEIVRARASEIAAVLVEPVQSRRLDLEPREFLHELRRVTEEIGAALVFDEVVTGFRVEPGGAQAYFNVRADLATYGKVIGGGLPIGVVAGSSRFMDALDGGQWQYGDSSFPEVGVTFFAGTFVRHPLVLAAARAVLGHLKKTGPQLQSSLALRTRRLADELRKVTAELQAPYVVTQFSSLVHINFPVDQKFAGLLFYLLRLRGIHIWENRAFILTTAHSDADLDRLLAAFRESVAELRAAGFIGGALVPQPLTAVPVQTSKESHEVNAGSGESFPLTEAQKEIWLAAQMGGDAAVAYNESLKLEFHGDFDVELFRQAVRSVIERHPILLASISRDGQAQQILHGSAVELPLTDLSSCSDSDRASRLADLVQGEVSEAFDLLAGPLLRVKIVRLSADHHVVLWTAHHIVCDGWSGGLVVSELAAIYSAGRQGTQPKLDPPQSFRAYALGAQQQTPDTQRAIDYWRETFAELPPLLDLPTDRPRARIRSARASTVRKAFATDLHQALKRLAGQQRTTLVVLLVSVLETLLYRLSGQTDLVIGLPAAGQAVTGSSCLVGHCVNLLPVRSRLVPEAGFHLNLAAMKKNVLDAFDHHQSTVGELLKYLSVSRTASRPPLVEVAFNVDRDPSSVEFWGLAFSCERNPKRALHFDLFFNFVEGSRGMYVECDYSTDLFDEPTLHRWLKHYETLLASVVADPAVELGRLPMLTDEERKELTAECNPAGPELAERRTLTSWFESQAEKTPNAPALTFEGQTLTYGELNRRSNQLAHYLKRLSVGPETLVGLFVARSVETVVGILGILKAGGAYLPMDPIYPEDRLAFMLDDAKAPVVLTQSALAGQLPSHRSKVVCFDTDRELLSSQPETNPASSAAPENAAYVIYTSGSTGKPKGTLVTHHNVVRLMRSTEAWYGFNEKDVWTFFHSHAFDFSVWELWGALFYGGRVVMVPYLLSRSPEEFYELLVREKVTVLNQTPSAFKQLMQAEAGLGPNPDLALRYVIFGGEALEMQSLEPWFALHGDQRPLLVNMYGITETTVHVTYRPVSAADVNSGSVIGIPIPDLRVYILDPYGQPVPIGVRGEIYVGGAGVARGYLNRDDLTKERFLPDPFAGKTGSALYRSGDLARFLPNRDIEYFGRIDSQVKIRGFRIELGEIEAVLGRHPAISHCIVVAQRQESEKRLVAYLQSEKTTSIDLAELRIHLKRQLPDYMIPSAFVVLEKFPLTANGKIDHQALPLPDESRLEPKKGFVAPRDPVEQMLAQLWAKVLKVKCVGVKDNFFDLGGHSILAVRIIVEIEKLYKRRLPLAALLEAPTVAELASLLSAGETKPSWSSLVPIRPGGSRVPFFLMHSHGGNVLEYYPLVNYLDVDQPVYALQARGLDGRIVRNQSMEQIAGAYIEEIRRLQPIGPYLLGGFCFGGLLAFEIAQQLKSAGEEIAALIMIQTVHPALLAKEHSSGGLGLWRQRIAKRFDLERENLKQRGSAYFRARFRHMWSMARNRAKLALESGGENGGRQYSLAYILESLGIEHDRAFANYKPRPYTGDVVLLRASKQLPIVDQDRTLGWKGVIQGNLQVAEVEGHQQNILMEPNVRNAARELDSHLNLAQHAQLVGLDQ